MAYGFQYIPDARTVSLDRPTAAASPASPTPVTTRVYRLGPATSAIAAAVESLYRDIEELRRSAADSSDVVEPFRAEAIASA